MGVYLSEPKKDKLIEEGKGTVVKYVAAGMQGILLFFFYFISLFFYFFFKLILKIRMESKYGRLSYCQT